MSNQKLWLTILLITLFAILLATFRGCVSWREVYDEHAIRSWRCYLANTSDTIQKILLLPKDAGQYRGVYLKVFMHGAAKTKSDKKFPYQLILKVDNTATWMAKDGVSSDSGWKFIPIDPQLIRGKDRIVVSFSVTGKPDLDSNYVNFYGEETTITTKTHRSLFNGSTDDLSPDPGPQRGEYLIRLVLRGKQKGEHVL